MALWRRLLLLPLLPLLLAAAAAARGKGTAAAPDADPARALLAFDGPSDAARDFLLAAAAPGPYPARALCAMCGQQPAAACAQCGARCCSRRCRGDHVAAGRCTVKPPPS